MRFDVIGKWGEGSELMDQEADVVMSGKDSVLVFGRDGEKTPMTWARLGGC